MKEVIRYEANDGTLHEKKEEAEKRDLLKGLTDLIEDDLGRNPDPADVAVWILRHFSVPVIKKSLLGYLSPSS